MAWADFWEMIDGRLWWELRKAGVPETRQYSDKERREAQDWITEQARKRGWVR